MKIRLLISFEEETAQLSGMDRYGKSACSGNKKTGSITIPFFDMYSILLSEELTKRLLLSF